MPRDPIDGFLSLAERLADAARGIVLPYFRTAIAVDRKQDETPVTVADREAEAAMRSLIRRAFPEHGIVGEEGEDESPEAEYVWVLDPIDGTKRFITGNPGFGTLVALLQEGRPILGLIDMPVLRERWLGAAGQPTLYIDGNGSRSPARVRPCPNLSQACLYSTTPLMFTGQDERCFEAVSRQVQMSLYGGECYAYGLVASGFADLVIEADLGAYDYLAHVPIVSGAGGIMTSWQGAALGLESGEWVVAAGDPRCHAAVVELLGSHKLPEKRK